MALRPDLVHAHDTYGLMVKRLPIPRVFTIHGFIYGDTLVSGHQLARLRAWLWRRIETSGWADQPHIVSISPYVRERLAGIATGVIHDIENPIAESFFTIVRSERPGTILSAALICPRKNTLALVEAFARVRRAGLQAELRLAGVVTDAEYGRAVEGRIRAHGLGESVQLLGGLSGDAVRRELAAASVFALVSLEENAPLGIEEAMAVGVPVVTSNRCGMPYLVRHGETGFLVDPHNPADIARRLERILTDDALRNAMAERSLREARERFHPGTVARRTRQLYRELVAEGSEHSDR
jgi:glycosyltransferase involved in cell wall biosynthesis